MMNKLDYFIAEVKRRYWRKTKHRRSSVTLAPEKEVEVIAGIAYEVTRYERSYPQKNH